MDSQSNDQLNWRLTAKVEELVNDFKMGLIIELRDYIEDHSGSNETLNVTFRQFIDSTNDLMNSLRNSIRDVIDQVRDSDSREQ